MVPEKPTVYPERFVRLVKNLAAAAVLLALGGSCLPLGAYIRGITSRSVPYTREDFRNIVYYVNTDAVAGLVNRNGDTVITADSAPTAAIRAALENWNEVADSSVRFAAPRPTSLRASAQDNINLITFADDPANRSLVGDAIAVTWLISDGNGRLSDTDIIFNPDLPFSTTLAEDTFDIEGTLTHELGHALGLDHAGSAVATMFATTTRQATRLRTLTADDIAFLRAVYPAAAGSGGSLTAAVTLRGFDARGALAAAHDPDQNLTVEGIVDSDGVARLGGLPAGNYLFYVEPLDEPTEKGQLSFNRSIGLRTDFRTTVVGGPDDPTRVRVEPLSDISFNVEVDGTAPTLNLQGAGGAPLGEPIVTFAGLVAERGGTYRYQIFGGGLDDPDLTLDSMSFVGTGVTISGPLEQDEIQFTDGTSFPRLRFFVTVADDAPLGTLTAAVRNASGELAVLTGAIEVIAPLPRPSFPAEGVVNAASFAGGPLAPGMIFSIFGVDLGPASGTPGVIDSISGRLTEGESEVQVVVGGRAAPLFYVSEGQINAQAPFDLTPGQDVAVEVIDQGVRSPAIVDAGRGGDARAVRLRRPRHRPEPGRLDQLTLEPGGARRSRRAVCDGRRRSRSAFGGRRARRRGSSEPAQGADNGDSRRSAGGGDFRGNGARFRWPGPGQPRRTGERSDRADAGRADGGRRFELAQCDRFDPLIAALDPTRSRAGLA